MPAAAVISLPYRRLCGFFLPFAAGCSILTVIGTRFFTGRTSTEGIFMADFTGIRFSGRFRAYQQRVLDHADRHLADGHNRIVAAPGSGKTILDPELICRLQELSLIPSL